MCADFTTNWFWTDALRNENSTTWFWETSGAEITEFFWEANEPSLDDFLKERICINFNPAYFWYDDMCE